MRECGEEAASTRLECSCPLHLFKQHLLFSPGEVNQPEIYWSLMALIQIQQAWESDLSQTYRVFPI